MNRTAVDSSLLASHGWEPSAEDPNVGTMEVQFLKDSSVYTYPQVPKSVWEGLKSAESAGKYFLANIRHKYGGQKVQPPKPDEAPKESAS